MAPAVRLQLTRIGAGALAACLLMAHAPALRAADACCAFRHLQIHGPFVLGPPELVALKQAGPGTGTPEEAGSPLPHICLFGCSQPSDPEGKTLPQSPKAQPNLAADPYNGGHDPGIAVSDSYVMVSSDKRIGVYDKSGKLLPQKTSYPFPNPFDAMSLFAPLLGEINVHLQYSSDMPPGFNPAMASILGDARVLFDPFRKRFFIGGMIVNQWLFDWLIPACVPANRPCTPDAEAKYATLKKYSGLRIAWRAKFVLAVSRTQDPRDGFYLYWWDGVTNDGACTDVKGCANEAVFKPGTANVDYPRMGISADAFLATVAERMVETDPASAPAITNDFDSWWNCFRGIGLFNSPGSGAACGRRQWVDIMAVPAGFLTEPFCGDRQSRLGVNLCVLKFPPRSFGLFLDEQDSTVNAITFPFDHSVHPVMHYSAVPSGEVYFTNPYVDPTPCPANQPACARSFYVVHGFTFGKIPGFSLIKVPVAKFTGIEFKGMPGSASFRDGRLYAAWQECHTWPDSNTCLHAVHMIRFSPSDPAPAKESSFIERIFGLRSVYGDPPSARRNYMFPAIDVTKLGDMAIVYARYGDDLMQEARFTVRYKDDPDVRPSRLLHVGEVAGNAPAGTDTAGIAVDEPFEDAVWLAHVYSDAKNGKRIAYGRVFGAGHSDISVSQVSVADSSVAAGGTVHVSAAIHNGGDAGSGPIRVDIYLSTDPDVTKARAPLGGASLRSIASGGDAPIDLTVQIPATTIPGDYYVTARVEQVSGLREYSIDNNQSPVLASEPRLHVSTAK